MNYLLTIIGPTAIGKTSLSIHLANYFNTSILSCDSRQFFKEMSIGTAAPTPAQLKQAPHYFIKNRSIFENYNVGKFERDAIEQLNKLFTHNNIVVMVGGSGLYVNAVLQGLDYFPEVNPSIRVKLKEELENNGIEALQEKLKLQDFKTYKSIDLSNSQRLIRALEICIGTALPYSSFKNKQKSKRDFTPITIGLTAKRELIYDRINMRVDLMIKQGLVEEAKKLYPNKKLNALQTVGYKELFSYFDGAISLDLAIQEIKKNTRRFAKRQLTWFKKDKSIKWFNYDDDFNSVITYIKESF